ncbi:MAG TPA: carbon-nitrogen hydrolase family protein [Candidatus Baltobacteraceae bacterium]|jgi:predicted amidohydrolase|nr:carbon-nitrogen hydrolase family protein [Candidatus Baltobacteraceae bacterium]
MTRTLRVAACQIQAHDRGALAHAWPRIRGLVRQAAADGARLVVLPEGTLPSYVLGYQRYDAGEIATALEECRALARELGIVLVIGAARQERGEERVFNSAIAIDADGSIAGHADKHFLWHFDRQWFAPGERIEPVRTSIGTLGVLICADGRIPLIASTLVDRGAEILVMPTAWVTSGRDPDNLENIQADLLVRVRARENGVPFVAANKCGVELGCVAYSGKSQIVASDGSVAAIASQNEEQFVCSDVQAGALNIPRPPLGEARTMQRDGAPVSPVRIAIAADDLRDEPVMEDRLRIVEAQVLVMPESTYPAAGNQDVPLVFVDDRIVLDPRGLAAYRLNGVDLAVWKSAVELPWLVAFARARALELRMYVIAIQPRGRAFAVDPDGAVVCGTFGGYRIASFTYDPARARQTLVAPGTDVRAGLERAHSHAQR